MYVSYVCGFFWNRVGCSGGRAVLGLRWDGMEGKGRISEKVPRKF